MFSFQGAPEEGGTPLRFLRLTVLFLEEIEVVVLIILLGKHILSITKTLSGLLGLLALGCRMAICRNGATLLDFSKSALVRVHDGDVFLDSHCINQRRGFRKAGIDQCIEAKQSAYDRYMSRG